jgi:large subunit ribosomal protein L13
MIDATEKPLGRVAVEAARLLQGKHTPAYRTHRINDDTVVIAHASRVRITGKKAEQKVYYRHTGYTGHLKQRTLGEAFARSPERVVTETVRGMLPKTALGRKMLKNLIVER